MPARQKRNLYPAGGVEALSSMLRKQRHTTRALRPVDADIADLLKLPACECRSLTTTRMDRCYASVNPNRTISSACSYEVVGNYDDRGCMPAAGGTIIDCQMTAIVTHTEGVDSNRDHGTLFRVEWSRTTIGVSGTSFDECVRCGLAAPCRHCVLYSDCYNDACDVRMRTCCRHHINALLCTAGAMTLTDMLFVCVVVLTGAMCPRVCACTR